MQRSDLLNDAERKLWDAFPRGRMVVLGDGDPTAEDFDPETWSGERQVRGEVIGCLLLGVLDREPGYVPRVALAGARIVGVVNISGGQSEYELVLRRCWFDEPPNFTGASSGPARIAKSRLPGLKGTDWQAHGSVSFFQSRCQGEISLGGAQISGRLVFGGAALNNPGNRVLSADGITVSQDMFCRDGLVATGEIRIIGAHIGGQFDLHGATLTNPGGRALTADGITVDQDLFGRVGFTATGEIRLLGAHIGGGVDFSGAILDNAGGDVISADRLTVGEGMFCRDGFTATGEIRLLGAHIGGDLYFNGATLTNPGGKALSADRLTVDRAVFCRDGFTATGELRLPSARIGGALYLSGATLNNPGGTALSADRLTVEQTMFCRAGFTATGQVSLVGAHIGAGLDLSGATVDNAGRLALDLEGAEAPRVRLPSAVDGWIDLTRARLGVLDLPAAADQPPMRLTGLTYADLDPDPDPPVRQRIRWLSRDPAGFHPQPYEQLAAYYRSIGHDRDARRVLLAKQRVRRRITPSTWRSRPLLRPLLAAVWRIPGWLVDALSGYGYVPWRAFCWLVVAVLTGAALLHDVAPRQPTGDSFANALLLSLDATVPTAPFGVREDVTLTGANYAVAFGLQILGYALVLAVLPAISRTLSRSDR